MFSIYAVVLDIRAPQQWVRLGLILDLLTIGLSGYC